MQQLTEQHEAASVRWIVPEASLLPSAYHRRRYQRAIKRLLDITVATLLLIVLVPVFLALALWIRLDSPGPVFFNRPRVGQGGRPFVMYKLRSMCQDAEQRLADLQHLNTAGRWAIKIRNDPRVTRAGRILRKTSLDELPQLLNVLKGEMSLVGPRPQAEHEVALYTPRERRRLEAVPGMTGLWQVTARHDPSFDAWVRWDLDYIDNWSLWLDCRILGRTVMTIWRDCRTLWEPAELAEPASITPVDRAAPETLARSA